MWPPAFYDPRFMFIVKAFNPPDGYYKADVYLYYALTFVAPLSVGWWRSRQVLQWR
jgi:hypothetical protein